MTLTLAQYRVAVRKYENRAEWLEGRIRLAQSLNAPHAVDNYVTELTEVQAKLTALIENHSQFREIA